MRQVPVRRDGRRIACVSLRNPGNGSDRRRIAILAHPINRKGKYWFSEGGRLKVYWALGYDPVLFDFNGFGESDRIDFYYWKDADAVVRAVSPGAEHVVFHGVSFGSFHMIRAIRSLPLNSSIVLENTPRSLRDYWKTRFVVGNAVRLAEFLRLPSVRDMRVAEVLESLDRRSVWFTLIACAEDRQAPADEMRDLAGHLKRDKDFVVFDGAGHFEAPAVGPRRYAQLLRRACAAG